MPGPSIPPFGEVSTDAPLFSQTPPRVAAHTVSGRGDRVPCLCTCFPAIPRALPPGRKRIRSPWNWCARILGWTSPFLNSSSTYFGNIITKRRLSALLRTKRPVSVEIGERFAATFLAHRLEHGLVGLWA